MKIAIVCLFVAVMLIGSTSGAKQKKNRPMNCQKLLIKGKKQSGIYKIYPYEKKPKKKVKVYCDMDTDGGGWTVIQRRDDFTPRQKFYLKFRKYAKGFGSLKKEFWLGLNHIHALTNQSSNEIRFDLADFDGNSRWAKYSSFYVHNKTDRYKLSVSGYTGTAGDSFSYHSGMLFYTKDSNNSCAVRYKGAWWYKGCHESNLNGQYLNGPHTSYADGINWGKWRGPYYSLKKTEMKIRPISS